MSPSSPAPVTQARSRLRFPELEGLRGVAAVVVCFAHLAALTTGRPITMSIRAELDVSFFFMLSGFVIAYAYADQLRSGMSAKDFFLRRAIRLYPLLFMSAFLGTLFYAIYDGGHFRFTPNNVIAPIFAAFAIPSPAPDFGFGWTYFRINPPEWSLYYEFLAYAVFCILISKCTDKVVAVATVIAFCINAYIVCNFAPAFWTGNFLIAATFGVGVLLWQRYRLGKLPRLTCPFMLSASMLVLICIVPGVFSPISDLLAFALIFPLVIISGIHKKRSDSDRMFLVLGELSYPLYILHMPVLIFARRLCAGWAGPIETIAISMAGTILFAWLMLVCFDQPIRRWLTARFIQTDAKIAVASNAAGVVQGVS